MNSNTLEINEELFTDEVDSTFNKVIDVLRAENIFPDSVQKQMLYSHLKAMVIRSHTNEPLPEVEIEMFDEISKSSHKLAEDVVKWFPALAYEETYLLSVHFEVAKENELTEELGA
ncbi:transcriptional regulator [Aliivibrio fischeri]|uniref:transcriptional regulator n=1 Tax=Aliivibrio fischeri TaxID=668 RepID=UPI0007C57351|nr:transcriptional regulator [Aliivibrio fischeri]